MVDLFRGSFRLPLLLALILAPCATALAGPLDDYVLFGVNGNTADLVRYDFAQNQYTTVGTIRSSSGQVFTGIEGTACVAQNLNLFGFWTDPADSLTKVVYINCMDATAAVVGQNLGAGNVIAASVVYWDEGQGGPSIATFGSADPTPVSVVREKRLFAVQSVASGSTVAVGGSININPSNSPNNEFVLTKPDGSTITRDDLHQNSPVDGNGAYYTGPALVGVRAAQGQRESERHDGQRPAVRPVQRRDLHDHRNPDGCGSLQRPHPSQQRQGDG